MVATLVFDTARLESLAGQGFSLATDVAEWLVRQGVPFRVAHELAGRVRAGMRVPRTSELIELSDEDFAAISTAPHAGGPLGADRGRIAGQPFGGRRHRAGPGRRAVGRAPRAVGRLSAVGRRLGTLTGVGIDRALLARPALQVAPALLGAVLTSSVGGAEVTVRITEVEAYEGTLDPASHAFRGPTRRNAVMFGEAGRLYCYFVYGMHWCANITCAVPGTAGAVLLRAAQILDGEPVAQARTLASTTSSLRPAKLASGPARLARVLGLAGEHTGLDLLDRGSPVRLIELHPATDYRTGPRVGVAVAAEHPWRFWLPDEPSVSAYRPGGRKRVASTRQTGAP